MPSQTARKKPAKRGGGRKAAATPVTETRTVEAVPQPSNGSYQVAPERIASKLNEKLNEASLELAMTQAAFEQRGEELAAKQSTIDQLNQELTDLRAKYEPEPEDEDEDSEE